MRAREIPHELFREIVEFSKISKTLKVHRKDNILTVVFAKRSSAVIGVTEFKCEEGIFSTLNVWNFSFASDWAPEDFFQSDIYYDHPPALKILAGPFKVLDRKDPELGHIFIEDIVVYYNASPSQTLEFCLDSPFLTLINHIVRAARILQRKVKPAKHACWERGFSSKVNYLD